MAKKQRLFWRQRTNSEQEAPKRGFPLISGRILAFSQSADFEEARREWEFTRMIEEGAEDFVDKCELCNHPGQKKYFEIVNGQSGKRYLVGSECIKKFIIFGGALTQEDSNSIFERQIKKQDAAKTLQALLPSILSEPTLHDLSRFSQTCKFILDAKENKDIPLTKWKEFIRLLFGKNPPKKEIMQRITLAIFDPRKINTKKVALSTGQKEGRWAGVTKVKRTRVQTTLSRSEAYRVGKDDTEGE